MKEATRELHRVRGDWNKASVDYRSWNEPRDLTRTVAPREQEQFAAYVAHKESQEARPEEVAAAGAPRKLGGGAAGAKGRLEDRVRAYRRKLPERAMA